MIYLILLMLVLLPIFIYYPKPKQNMDHADCILVLGCPTHEDGSLCQTQIRRCKKAIDLWYKQKAPLIMISGGKAHNATCEAEAMAEYIHQSDPQIPILMETKAMNTYDNFKYSKQLCDQRQIHSIIVVTSTSHCRRSAYFTRKFFDEFAMIGDDEPFSLKKRTREFFAKYNTLYCEIKIKLKKNRGSQH